MLVLNPIAIIGIGIALLVFGAHPVITLIGFTAIAIPATILVIHSIKRGN